MSEENVEAIRSWIEAWNTGALDSVLGNVQPDAEWQSDPFDPDAETYRGPEGVRRFLGMWEENFAGLQLEIEQTLDAGDSVVVAHRLSGRGRASGAEAERLFFSVYELRDGMLVRYRQYENRAEAFEAAGLSE
jgi:ketosteroid isomerase-like protein